MQQQTTIDSSTQSFNSTNPANNDILWQGNKAGQNDVESKVSEAHTALMSWSALSINDRIDYLTRYQQALEKNQVDIATTISLETGKPAWETKTEVTAMINKVKLSIAAFHQRTSTSEQQHADHNAFIRYKPHGVMAVLGPFNFPGHFPNGHIVPALLAGNTVVFKPSEFTPLVAEKMFACWQQAGLPEGVLSLVHGDKETGKALLNSKIDGVLFTGSYTTGQIINQHFASRPEIILALEMGGNSPIIIDDNIADIDAAVYHSLVSAFITAGQRCSCARRLIIPDNGFGEKFIEKFIKQTKAIHIGQYDQNPQPFMGPVIDKSHAKHHLSMQQDFLQLGGEALLTMESLSQDSAFLSPGIIDMSNVSQAHDDEVFAPLVRVYRYQEFEQGLELANETSYGLAAGLFSDDATKYKHFYQDIRAGIVNWNRPITGASSQAPFGGIGKSGNHRPSAYFAADYCSYPIASLEQETVVMPSSTLPGLTLS